MFYLSVNRCLDGDGERIKRGQCIVKLRLDWLIRRRLIYVAGLIVIVVAASLVILHENGFFVPNPPPPTLAHVVWQNTLEHSAYELAVGDGRVFTFDSDLVNAFDAESGRLLWRVEQGNYFGRGLIVSGGGVYVGHSGAKVVCLDEVTGTFQWIFQAPYNSGLFAKRAPAYLAVVDGRVFAVGDGLAVHSAYTGQLLWEYADRSGYANLTDKPNEVNVWPLEGDRVYGTAGYGGSGAFLCSFDAYNGTILWRTPVYLWPSGEPLAYQEHVIFPHGNGRDQTGVFSFDSSSGEHVWSFNINETSIQQPVIKNDLLLFGASDGRFYNVNPENGTLNWNTTLDSREGKWTEPQIFNNQIFVGYQDTIYNLDANTGQLLWNWSTPNSKPITGLAISSLSNLLYATWEQNLQTFSAADCSPQWSQYFEHYVRAPIAAYNKVYIAGDGYMIAYE
ncbi:PQQ-binding-like beta-propeller repeat protein [Candidatus Bathyarchaeota archaeon]|nr:PQQ-binding-like beta-propeller repeat protein [Candidatus Bathyarchaeota archaeon]